jgi:hypothetical protein
MRGLRAQRCHPLVELILVDLAAGEPPGQDLLGRGRCGRGGWPGLAVRASPAGVAPVGRQQPLATPGEQTNEGDDGHHQQRPERQRTQAQAEPDPAKWETDVAYLASET